MSTIILTLYSIPPGTKKRASSANQGLGIFLSFSFCIDECLTVRSLIHFLFHMCRYEGTRVVYGFFMMKTGKIQKLDKNKPREKEIVSVQLVELRQEES